MTIVRRVAPSIALTSHREPVPASTLRTPACAAATTPRCCR